MFQRQVVLCISLAIALFILASPSGAQTIRESGDSTTCVVLSVGGPKGLAHLGALDAIRNAGVHVDYVFGNSMGAVVGALYASDPAADLPELYRATYDSYLVMSRRDATRRGAATALLGAVVTGGASLLVAAACAFTGYASTEPLDAERFQRTLNWYYEERSITDLQIPFATSYYEVINSSPILRICSTGNIAEAVSRSANNPLIFKTADISRFIDPGVDRVSATPIEEAFEHFHPDRIIAINTTGQAAFYDHSLPCEIIEIMVDDEEANASVLSGRGDAFELVYANGYSATVDALVRSGLATNDNLPRVSPRRVAISAKFMISDNGFGQRSGRLSVIADGTTVIDVWLTQNGGEVSRSAEYRDHRIDVVAAYGTQGKCAVTIDNEYAGNWQW